MPKEDNSDSARQNVEAVTRDRQRRAAQDLFEQLTAFADSIAAEASGDGEFDVEFSHSIYQSRACLLRWIAMNAPNQTLGSKKSGPIS